MDEIQIAAKKGQTLFKTFEKRGFYDKQYLLRNDIKIVEFSATPDGIVYDQTNWGQHSFMKIMPPGDGYMVVLTYIKMEELNNLKICVV